MLDYAHFSRALHSSSLFKSLVSDLASEYEFEITPLYKFSMSTTDNYTHPGFQPRRQKDYDLELHGPLVGDFVDIRATLDYSWHCNYSEERQRWQDHIVKSIAYRQTREDSPWLVFTCGAMGAGKGYTMAYMSKHGIFPLESIVQIDPDALKGLMPEWQGYIDEDKANGTRHAGAHCHRESGYLQELATESALRAGGNIWVDGSLQDHDWYKNHVFRDVRHRYPQYRIALFYVYCGYPTLKERAYNRGLKTGRFIAENVLESAYNKTKTSVEVLGPLCDFVLHIDNEDRTPRLAKTVNYSPQFSTVRQRFSRDNQALFPQHLRPMQFVAKGGTLDPFEWALTPAIKERLPSIRGELHSIEVLITEALEAT